MTRIPFVVSQIISQLRYRWKDLGKPNIETVFIGGGTPSMLPNKELKRLLLAIKEVAPNPLEWTIESNPESIDTDFLQTCSEYGVDRLSIGVQSFNDSLLNTMGREAKNIQIHKALKLVKERWSKSFSIDLISSVPGQNPDLVLEDVKSALKFKPDHISFYALALEEGTVLEDEVSKGIVQELGESEAGNVWLAGRELLLSAGYKNYEVSNYTINKPCLHNINYWELKPYLGIGPGAVSTLINKKGDIVRVTNKKSISAYLEGEQVLWGEETENLSSKDFLEDYIMMGMRLGRGIDRKRFIKIFNIDVVDVIPITDVLMSEGLLKVSGTHYALTAVGFDLMNSVLVRILESIEAVKINRVNWFY